MHHACFSFYASQVALTSSRIGGTVSKHNSSCFGNDIVRHLLEKMEKRTHWAFAKHPQPKNRVFPLAGSSIVVYVYRPSYQTLYHCKPYLTHALTAIILYPVLTCLFEGGK